VKNFFMIVFCLILILLQSVSNINGQVKLYEGFEENIFPPEGWSIFNTSGDESQWKSANTAPKLGSGCAVSNFSGTNTSSYIISKRFTPAYGDSLVFYFKQTFYNVFQDTLKVLISNTDSLFQSMTTQLALFREGLNYPVYNVYTKAAVSLNQYAGQTVWIAFCHSNLNGENIRIDEVMVGKPARYEVGVEKNVYPSGNIGSCEYPFIIPKAIIKNYGSVNITQPFEISYSISGPVNYTSIRHDTIRINHEKEIFFDTLLTLQDTGRYFVKIFTSMDNDENRNNDTVYSEFKVVQSNYLEYRENYFGYYFSNSSQCANSALSKPEFCLKDNSGNMNLILNGMVLRQDLFSGNTDDGYFKLGDLFNSGRKIKFNENLYDSVFITTNGIIAFTESSLLTTGEPLGIDNLLSGSLPFIAPLWMNFDFGNSENTENRLSCRMLKNHLIISYEKVPLKNEASGNFVSFQIILETVEALDSNSRIIFQYDFESTGIGFYQKLLNQNLPDNISGILNSSRNEFLYYRKSINGTESYPGPLFNGSLAVEFGKNPMTLNSRCTELSLTALIESIENDTVTVSLSYPEKPAVMLESRKVNLNEGNGICSFSLGENDVNYFVNVRHNNSIQVWSSAGTLKFNNCEMNYDFSTDPSKAYGNNLKMINGKAHLYTGDVNQDGMIEGIDLSQISNDAVISAVSQITDLNGDGITDGSDVLIAENNANIYIAVIAPK